MSFIREQEVEGKPVGNLGSLKHLAAPWTVGTQSLWLGVVTIEKGGSTKANALQDHEGLHYTLQGRGTEIVAGEKIETSPGTCVFIPKGALHQIINTGTEPLKVLSVTTPPIPKP